MRVLIDTNIFIYREDDRVISENLQKLLAIMQKFGVSILIHPQSIEDLQEDANKKRQEIMLSKIRAYPLLEKPPQPDNDTAYLNALGRIDDHNTWIDAKILYSLYRDAVDFLITEDRDIPKKARKLNIENRVFLISDALQFMEGYFTKDAYIAPPSLVKEPVYSLDINDPIFDSLKASYPEFEEWFKKISRVGRDSWVYHREDGKIGALLIYKIEDESIISTENLPKKLRLKISSFKVTHVGYKIGELFIKIACDFAVKNGIDELYFTMFPNIDNRLIDLTSEYGFKKHGTNLKGEEIYIKRIIPESKSVLENMSPLEIDAQYYPCFYDGDLVRKYIIPIRPKYLNKLFTDLPERQLHQIERFGFLTEGNTIRKAYVCNSVTRKLKIGDIILFYVSQQQKITTLGIIESVDYGLQNVSDILRKVGKRTVYSMEDLEDIALKPTTVIMFRHHFHFGPIIFNKLKAHHILKRPPQSITEISDENYREMLKMDGIDGRFIIH
jgi:rRNA-processing protein FCF1